MQPYFFPYIGYFQLANYVDKFIFLDDVNFFKKGFINRNSLIFNSRALNFTIPVSNVSQNRNINEHYYLNDFSKFLQQIRNSYRDAPYFEDVYPWMQAIIIDDENNVAIKNSKTIISVFDYIGVEFNCSFSSESPTEGEKDDLIINICKKQNFDSYYNLPGGVNIYSNKKFLYNSISLNFLQSSNFEYPQKNINEKSFIKNISIIDLLMNSSKDYVAEVISKCEFFKN